MWYFLPVDDARAARARAIAADRKRVRRGVRWSDDRFTVSEIARFCHLSSEGVLALARAAGVKLRKEGGWYRRLTRAQVYRMLVEKHRKKGEQANRAAERLEASRQKRASMRTGRPEPDE